MRVFISGASSAIGRALAEGLAGEAALTLLRHRRPVPDIAGAEVVDGGLEGAARWPQRVRAADVVVHLAGLSHAASAADYDRVNRDGTRALLAACRPGQRFLYVSTRCVGPAGGAYSRSKAEAEAAVRASGLDHALLRPAEVYGSSAEGIGALVGLALRRRVMVDLRAWPEVRYSPITLEELAGALIAAVRTAGAGEVYTLCNDRGYTARELRAAIEEGLGRRVWRLVVPVAGLRLLSALRLPMPFKRDQLARLTMDKSEDNSLARARLGFAPRCFLERLREAAREHRGAR